MAPVKIIIWLLFMICSKTDCLTNPGLGLLPGEVITGSDEDIPTLTGNLPEMQIAQITDGLSMGDPDAPVQIIEFADFQCPGCGYYWSEIEPAIITEYIDTGKVYFTYVPFSFLGQYGSDPNWDESVKAAEAAYCANDQGAFWEYRGLLFANQNGENQGAFNREQLISFAYTLGLDHQAFVNCLDSGDYTQAVNDDYNFAMEQGSTFTPSFLIDGMIVDSSQLIDTIEQGISQ